jgi:hypothetical protein
MTPGAPALVLRLSVPVADGFRAVARDLATKVAEYVGCAPDDAARATAVLESLAAEVAPGDAAGDVTFEFHQVGEELRIDARCGSRSSNASLRRNAEG